MSRQPTVSTDSVAQDVVRETLTAAIPPGSPLMFKSIVHAHTTGKGRNRFILADLILFDDAPAAVKLEPFQWGWSIQWMYLPGGAFYLGPDNVWKRAPLGEAQVEAA